MKLPVGEDAALLPSLLTLSDVFPTGQHCAVRAGVGPRTTVTVIGATDVIAECGEEGVDRVWELTGGDGTHTVLECV